MLRLRPTINMRNLGLRALVVLAFLGVACQNSATLTSLTVTPEQPTIAKGMTQQFTATGGFSDGTTQDVTSQVAWATFDQGADVGVATITAAGLATGATSGVSTITATYMNVTAKALLTVTGAAPTSMNITPSNPSIANGTSQQFVAKATLTDDTIQDVSSKATWTITQSSGASVVTVDANGVVKGVGVGDATVTATFMGASASAHITVTSAVITGITVTPSNPAIAKGTTQQFTAIATFTDNTTQDLTSTATWTAVDIAPDANVATIAATGLATSKGLGSSTIMASFGGKSSTARLTVTAAVLASVAISPSAPSLAKGTTQQFTATATFTDATTQDVTSSVTWSATDIAPAANVATITTGGLVTGKGLGSATIKATLGATSATATLTVTQAVLTTITLSPSAPSIAKGTTQQFTATATFTDATTQDVTRAAVWTDTDVTGNGVTSVDANGLVIGLKVGTATITATSGGKSGSATLTVTAAVVTAVSISPSGPSVAKGTAQQFTATATLSDASTQDVTTLATWTTADVTGTGVASVDAAGKATGASIGKATITATYLGFSGTASLTVTAAVINKVTISPEFASIAKGTAQQFAAIATFTDNTTQDVTNLAVWTATDVTGTAVTSVSATGKATGANIGKATVTATYMGFAGTTTLTVTAAVVASIAIAPATPSIAKGTAQQFTALATFTDTTTQDVTNLATWTSVDVTGTGVASVGTTGLATGTGVGKATISAAYLGATGNATLTVTAALVTKLTVTPATPSIAKGATQQFTAIATLSDASTQDVTNLATWASADVTGTGVASINATGRATGASVGKATITATYQGSSDTATLTVTTAVPVSITITPAPLNIPRNMVVQLTATLVYSDSTTTDVTATATWSSDTPTVTTVSATGSTGGRARGVAAGTAVIKATASGLTGQATATVTNCYVTINEIATAGTGGANDEFVELYNGCPFTVDLNNSRLLYRSIMGVTDVVMVNFTMATPITAGGFLLYVGTAYPAGAPRNGGMVNSLSAAGGGLGLSYTAGYTNLTSDLIFDSVGYGAATNIYVEDTPAAAPASASSIRRKPNGTDTNKNSVDFAVTTTPTPGATNG